MTATGSNQEATKQAGEPNHAGNAGGHSVWFSWTPSESEPVGISTPCFSGFEALIAVYTGSDVDALTAVASNQGFPAPNCFGESPEVEFTASAGTTYWIAVDGKDGAQGSYSFTLKGAPENDDFADALTIGADLPQEVHGSTKFATKQAGEPDHAGEPGGHSVWYSWTPSSSGPVDVSTCSPYSSLDSVLAVYTGSAVGSLTPVAANDDGFDTGPFPECRGTDSEVRIDAVAGTTYRIAIDGASGTTGRFNLRIQGRPANDAFANAQTLSPSLPTFSGASLRLATKEAGEPDHDGDPGGHSVWFSWTPANSGPVAINTCAFPEEELHTLLAVYTGSAVNALTPVASGGSAVSGMCGPEGSEAQFFATGGTTYRIAVDGKGGAEGRFSINLEGGPANDGFANAQSLGASLPVFAYGTTRLATKQAGEPDHAGDPGGHSVWYSWTPASSGPVAITACPYSEGGGDPVLAAYTGSAVDGLTPVASDDAGGSDCSPRASEVRLSAVAGTTYRIAVDAKGGSGGGFSLEIQGRPSNDDFATPDVLPSNPMTAGGTTVLATKQAGEPNHAGNAGGHSVWFSWTPATSGPIDITACGREGGIDTLLAVYTGSAVNALTPVASNDDAAEKPLNEFCESPTGSSEVEFDAAAGTTYRIAVDAKDGGEGRFGLAFEPAPANDDFANAATLSAGLPSYGSASTKLATKQAGEPDHAGDPGGHSVWYSWTPASSGPVSASTCTYRGNLDTLLAVYTGSAVNALTPVASNDDAASQACRPTDSEVEFDAVAGTSYRIAVDGKGGSWGGFQLTLEGAAANDEFGKPQSLGDGLPRWDRTSNRFATKQSGEPDHAGNAGGASIWFKWTAPRSGKVSVDTCGSRFDTLLAVYTGSAVDALTPVASNDESSGKCAPQSKLSFDAVAGTVYRIAVDGKAGATGSVELHIDGPPGNDDFANSETIPGSLGWYVQGSTVLATKQAGEPNHAGDPGGHSVWYSWTPSKSGAVEVETCGHAFPPLFAVYTGSAVDNLTPVEATVTAAAECDEGSSTLFQAIAGTTYRFAVDGAGGDDGHFELHLTAPATHPHTLTLSRAGAGAGSVTSSPAGIACGPSCKHDFEAGTVVTLTAEPAAGSVFAGWSGGGCAGAGTCEIILSADMAVTATFESAPRGSEGGGGGGPPAGREETKPKPLHCKAGFKKVRVHGKPRCVKKTKRKHRGGRRSRR